MRASPPPPRELDESVELRFDRLIYAIEEMRETLPSGWKASEGTPLMNAAFNVLLATDWLPAVWAEDWVPVWERGQ